MKKPKGPKPSARVTHVERKGARLLLTLYHDPVVDDLEDQAAAIKGAIVRIEPSPASTPEDVAAMREAVVAMGAVAVKVLPMPGADAAHAAARPAPDASLITPRQAVQRAVDEARVSDRDALAVLCEVYCAKAGL